MPHITSLECENVKRIKALKLEPSPKGLTVLGGKNGQGKTSALDAIAWALGGAKFTPSKPNNADAINNASVRVTLSNGIIVERAGAKGALKVIDPEGQKSGQKLLDSFVSEFALDLPKFMNANTKDKAQILLGILGIGEELSALEKQEQSLYQERHTIGQIAAKKSKYAEELPEYPDAPDEPQSISDLIQQQQTILAKNGENQRKREHLAFLSNQKIQLEVQIVELQEKLQAVKEDLTTAQKSATEIQDESTTEIEQNISEFEALNARVTANQEKARANDEAAEYQAQYDEKTEMLEAARAARMALLDNAALPLQGLAVQDGELVYNGQKWDCMAGSEQLRVAVAIVRKLNPECQFVLIDKLEQLDSDTLREFGEWLESENLQGIATRVSTNGEECSIIIEDGLPAGQTFADVTTVSVPKEIPF